MMRTTCFGPALIVIFLISTSPVDAAWTYAFDRDNYIVAPNHPVTVNVYLQETETTVLEQGVGAGLIGAGVNVVFNDPPLPSSPALIRFASDVTTTTSAFPDTWNKTFTAGESAGLLLGAGLTDNVYGVETSPGSGTYRALLGTFTFTAGSVTGEQTFLRATDYATTSDTITGDFEELDGRITDGHATITVATTPEPGTLVMLGAAGLLAILLKAYRRLRIGA